jgi:hypothetical protein
MTCLGLRPARIRGRGDRVPPEGRALHARDGTIAPPRHVPGWPPRHRQPSGGNEIASLASGPYLRTHGVRPSEKIAFRVVFALSPLGDAHCDWPPPGGAGSARPSSRLRFHPGITPLGHQTFVCPRWLCYASACVWPRHADARSASLRENRPRRYPRVSPARPSQLG